MELVIGNKITKSANYFADSLFVKLLSAKKVALSFFFLIGFAVAGPAQPRSDNPAYYTSVLDQFEATPNKEKAIISACDSIITYGTSTERSLQLMFHFLHYLKAAQKPIPYKLYLAMGTHYNYGGGATLAMDNVLMALRQPEIKQDQFALINAHYQLGYLFYHAQDYAEAIKYLIMAEKNPEHIHLAPKKSIRLYNTLGLAFFKTNQFAQAEKYYLKAIATATVEKDTFLIGLAQGNLGFLYLKQKKYNEALILLSRDVRISIQFKEYGSAVLSLCDMVGIYLETKELKNAEAKLSQAFSLLKNIEREMIKLPAFYHLYDVASVYYETIAEYEKALYFKKAGQLAKNEELDTVSRQNLQNIKFRFQEEENLLAIGELTQQKKEQDYYFYFIVFCLAATIGFVLLGAQKYVEKKRSNRVLIQYNQEILAQKEQLTAQGVILQAQNATIQLQNEDLQRANQTKSKLFALIGHDLRAPLSSLKLMIDAFKEGDFTAEELQDALPLVNDQLVSTLNLTDDLMYWGRVQLEGMSLNPQEIAVPVFIEDMAKGLRPLALAKQIAIEVAVCPAANKVRADVDMVKAVFRNLISNAIKFSHEKGTIRLQADNSADGKSITFTVADQGMGIAPQNLKKLFGNSNFTTKGTKGEKGTGFGLMLCKDFVNLNGGEIWADSELGRGTTIYFTLPTV